MKLKSKTLIQQMKEINEKRVRRVQDEINFMSEVQAKLTQRTSAKEEISAASRHAFESNRI